MARSWPVDILPLVTVITTGILGLATAGIAIWTTRTTAKNARLQREQQRSADAYLQVLQLAELEAQWVDSLLHNLHLDWDEVRWGVTEVLRVPEPAVTDRASASALLAAFGSAGVRAQHAGWRAAADQYREFVTGLLLSLQADGDPDGEPSREQLEIMKGTLQPAERAQRTRLAELIASELGHR